MTTSVFSSCAFLQRTCHKKSNELKKTFLTRFGAAPLQLSLIFKEFSDKSLAIAVGGFLKAHMLREHQLICSKEQKKGESFLDPFCLKAELQGDG